jgi:hypothetical protein
MFLERQQNENNDKISKEEAGYENPSPKPEQSCGNCSMIYEEDRQTMCTLVEGVIDEDAWCEYWESKTEGSEEPMEDKTEELNFEESVQRFLSRRRHRHGSSKEPLDEQTSKHANSVSQSIDGRTNPFYVVSGAKAAIEDKLQPMLAREMADQYFDMEIQDAESGLLEFTDEDMTVFTVQVDVNYNFHRDKIKAKMVSRGGGIRESGEVDNVSGKDLETLSELLAYQFADRIEESR